MNDIIKGQLTRWNDDRGFGFITPENARDEIFIHISALKNMSRRPVVGDVILYQLHTGNDGKIKAVNAKIDGVSFSKTGSRYQNDQVKHHWSVQIIFIASLVAIGFFAHKQFTAANRLSSENYRLNDSITGIFKGVTRKIEKTENNYACDGRTQCFQMTSCEEANFFITHCPNTKMDGDHDGIPCETQWCDLF